MNRKQKYSARTFPVQTMMFGSARENWYLRNWTIRSISRGVKDCIAVLNRMVEQTKKPPFGGRGDGAEAPPTSNLCDSGS